MPRTTSDASKKRDSPDEPDILTFKPYEPMWILFEDTQASSLDALETMVSQVNSGLYEVQKMTKLPPVNKEVLSMEFLEANELVVRLTLDGSAGRIWFVLLHPNLALYTPMAIQPSETLQGISSRFKLQEYFAVVGGKCKAKERVPYLHVLSNQCEETQLPEPPTNPGAQADVPARTEQPEPAQQSPPETNALPSAVPNIPEASPASAPEPPSEERVPPQPGAHPPQLHAGQPKRQAVIPQAGPSQPQVGSSQPLQAHSHLPQAQQPQARSSQPQAQQPQAQSSQPQAQQQPQAPPQQVPQQSKQASLAGQLPAESSNDCMASTCRKLSALLTHPEVIRMLQNSSTPEDFVKACINKPTIKDLRRIVEESDSKEALKELNACIAIVASRF